MRLRPVQILAELQSQPPGFHAGQRPGGIAPKQLLDGSQSACRVSRSLKCQRIVESACADRAEKNRSQREPHGPSIGRLDPPDHLADARVDSLKSRVQTVAPGRSVPNRYPTGESVR